MTSWIELTTTLAKDRMMMASLLDGNHKNARTKRVNIWNKILEREIETGSSFLVAVPETAPFLFVGLTQEIIPIPRARKGGDRFWAYLNRRYGIGEAEDHSKHILDSFRTYALSEGARVAMRRFAAYKTDTQTAYLSAYNGQQWRIDGSEVMPISNGEDDVFFIDDDGGVPCTPEVGPNGVLFEKLIDPISFADAGMGGISAEQMKRAMIVWVFSLAFPDIMPTKPLLIVEGAPGSGKSASLQLLQTALMGQRKPIILSANRPDDFGVLLLRSPICVFDNLDSYVDWLPDAVCSYTTLGQFPRRKLFTDAEELILKPHAFIAVASKNPSSFRREDTADRLIIMRLERRDSAGLAFTPFAKLDEEITALRPQLLGEYMHYVNLIVAKIREGAMAETRDERFRMGDFAALARVVGSVLGWTEEIVDDLLLQIQCEQTAFHNEADSTTDLLHRWLTYRVRGKPSNIGRLVDLGTLHREMEFMAQGLNIQFYKAQVLVQKLRSPHIERDFIVETALVNGGRTYRIWRKTDPKLTLVPAQPEDIVERLEASGVISDDDDDDIEPGVVFLDPSPSEEESG